MFDIFTPFHWPTRFVAWATPRLEKWSLDRSLSRLQGERELKARNYPEAERHFAQAVTEADAHRYSMGKRIRLRLQLAEAQRKRASSGDKNFDCAKLAQAEQTVRAAILEAAKASDRTGYVLCLDALAEIFTDQNNFPAVEKVMQEAIRIEVALTHPDPLRMARRVHRLGIARHRSGRSEEALPALEKAQALHEELYGEEHIETAHVLTELGAVCRAEGLHERAQNCLRRALRIHEKECGAESPEAIKDLHHLAGSLEDSGDLEGAAQQYERALHLKERVVGGDLDELADMQFGVAGLYIGWGNYSRARELLAEAIGTFKRTKGARLAVAYETLAHVEECSGRYHDAVRELTVAARVWESCGAARATELAENLERRAELLEQLRKKGEAHWLRERRAELLARAHAS
jgi:tetratricopeptide (TPR) repeat protein